jgi:hypothetical protein
MDYVKYEAQVYFSVHQPVLSATDSRHQETDYMDYIRMADAEEGP